MPAIATSPVIAMLAVFSDRAYIPEGKPHHALFYPFWGKNAEDPRDPNAGRLDRYLEVGGRSIRLTTLHEADLAVFPCDWSSVAGQARERASANELLARAAEAGKRMAVFFTSDSTDPVGLDGATVFRTSLRRSAGRRNEFAQPAWSEDFLERYLGNRVPVTEKRARPVVGFCGLVAPSTRFGLPIQLPLRRQERLRSRALDLLARERSIDTNFVRRDRFLGGALSTGELDVDEVWRVRREYVDNIVESDYVLCVRGAGNFSYRLYETLSCGRIPVFVDTDCVLPYDFVVDWRDYCVWIEERDVDQIADRVLDFHERLSASDFVDLQHACRRFWEEYLSPQGFFANFYRHLQIAHS